MSIENKDTDIDKIIVYEVLFQQVHVNSAPRIQEEDDRWVPVFPHEARMRNLTYSTEVFCDIQFSKKELLNEYYTDTETGQRKRKLKKLL